MGRLQKRPSRSNNGTDRASRKFTHLLWMYISFLRGKDSRFFWVSGKSTTSSCNMAMKFLLPGASSSSYLASFSLTISFFRAIISVGVAREEPSRFMAAHLRSFCLSCLCLFLRLLSPKLCLKYTTAPDEGPVFTTLPMMAAAAVTLFIENWSWRPRSAERDKRETHTGAQTVITTSIRHWRRLERQLLWFHSWARD